MQKLFAYDKKNKKTSLLIGTDEAGRGPLAGGVVAAAVCFQKLSPKIMQSLELVNDSKKLTSKQRIYLYDLIKDNSIYSIKEISVEEIEKINILQSSLKAMKLACNDVIAQISSTDCEIYVDGNKKIPDFPYVQKTIVKGDGTSASIAAASILAKVYRDNLMIEYHEKYPEYDFLNNKGYGTQKHVQAILKYGITPIHRKSFLQNILNQANQVQLTIEF